MNRSEFWEPWKERHTPEMSLSEAVRWGKGRGGRPGRACINIFPRRSIFLVRRNGSLPAPCGHESPSGQKQIKAYTLQIGGLPQLAGRLEFSAALTEKSLSLLLPISLSPCSKRKSHPLQPSGRPLAARLSRGGGGGGAGSRVPGSGKGRAWPGRESGVEGSAPGRASLLPTQDDCAVHSELSATTDL